MVVGSQDSPVVVKGIPISAWLDKVFTGGTMPAQENNILSLFRFGVGFPRLPRRGREDPDFSFARPSSHWRGHARTVKPITSSYFGLVAGSQESQCVVRKIPNSAWLDNVFTRGAMPAE